MKDRSWIKSAKIMVLTHGSPSSDDDFKYHLERIRPDAVMGIGCTHDGVTNYLSRIGPNRGEDSDRRTRRHLEIAHSLGIKVIATHSGVGNRAAGDAHPEWVRLRSDGSKDPATFAGWRMDLTSPYPEEWFLPQVEEMLRDYGADGLWVDGDCWYLYPCYSERLLALFRERTGLEAPRIDEATWQMIAPTASVSFSLDVLEGRSREEVAAWREWMRFNREIFWDFQRKAGELCHRYGAIYASNGTHSVDSGPVPVPECMDLLSHDIPGYESSGCFMASLKARFNETQGVPHDVMTWDYNSRNPWSQPKPVQSCPKSRKQYFCEVCSALASGAIWTHWTSFAHTQNAWEIADFIHAREGILFGTSSAADIAVLHTSSSFFVHSGGFLSTKVGNMAVWAAAGILWEGGYAFDVVGEHALAGSLDRYKLIILANQTHLAPEAIALLTKYVRDGGRILVAGRSGLGDGDTQALAEVLGIRPRVVLDPKGSLCVPADPSVLGEATKPYGADLFVLSMATECVGVVPDGCEVQVGRMSAKTTAAHDNAGPIGWLWRGHGLAEDKGKPVLTRHRYGSGEAWYLAADAFAHYAYTRFYGAKNLVLSWLERVHPTPVARARGSLSVECALRKKGDLLFCHLVNINTVGHNNVFETQAEGDITVHDVVVTVRLPAKPKRVTLAPEGKPVAWKHGGGVLTVEVGTVDIMETLQIEMR